MNTRYDCSKCRLAIPTGKEQEAFGILYHEKCAPKRVSRPLAEDVMDPEAAWRDSPGAQRR